MNQNKSDTQISLCYSSKITGPGGFLKGSRFLVTLLLPTALKKGCTPSEATPTASFQLPDVVTGEPARVAVDRALPPAPLLLPAHTDDVAPGERELVLVGLLESEARLEERVAAPAALRHVLEGRRGRRRPLSPCRHRPDVSSPGRRMAGTHQAAVLRLQHLGGATVRVQRVKGLDPQVRGVRRTLAVFRNT